MGQRTITIRVCDRCSQDIDPKDEDAGTVALDADEGGVCPPIRGFQGATYGVELCGPCVRSLRLWWQRLDHLCDRERAHPNPPAASPDGAGTDSTG
jgi:hypothetical protein